MKQRFSRSATLAAPSANRFENVNTDLLETVDSLAVQLGVEEVAKERFANCRHLLCR